MDDSVGDHVACVSVQIPRGLDTSTQELIERYKSIETKVKVGEQHSRLAFD